MKRVSFATAFSFGVLLLITCFAFLYRLDRVPLYIWDEVRNGNNALQMYSNGNWIVTYYDGSPELWNTKPPLLIWMQVALMKTIGLNEWAVRLPSALSAMATCFVLWAFARRQFRNPWTGLIAGSILATSFGYIFNHGGRSGDYDTVMILFNVVAAYALYLYAEEERPRWLWIFWIAMTLAALTKGIAALMITPGFFFFLLLRGKVRDVLTQKAFWGGVAIFLLLVGGYYGLREYHNPGYLKAVSENELGGRYLKVLEEHNKPFWFYWNSMRQWLFTFWKWFALPSLILVPVLGREEERKVGSYHLLLLIPFFLVISSAQTKLEWYCLPLYPFLSLQIAMLLSMCWRAIAQLLAFERSRKLAGALLFTLLMVGPAIRTGRQVLYNIGGPYDIDPHRQSWYIKKALDEGRDLNGYTFLYQGYHGQVLFYVNKLRLEGKKVELQDNVDYIAPGTRVVVSQPTPQLQLLQRYRTRKLEEYSGCTVYLVESSL